jgi:dTDP-4-amino-4,6-dideoxygalactose transaminase
MHNYGTPADTGINSRLDPLQAAFLRVKLRWLDGWNEMRAENANAYRQAMRYCNAIVLPSHDWRVDKPSWHIFAIETDNRDDLASYLREHGVETMVHYPRVPYNPIHRVPEAERWVSRTLSLPIAPHVTPEDCRQIGELINQWTHSRVS